MLNANMEIPYVRCLWDVLQTRSVVMPLNVDWSYFELYDKSDTDCEWCKVDW